MSNLTEIKKFLGQNRLDFKIIDLEEEAFTVEDVVKAGVKTDEIVKTLVISTQLRSSPGLEQGQGSLIRFVALALRGSDRLDFKKVRKIFGAKTELARPEEVLEVVGVPIGAVCPVEVGIPVYFDKNVMDLKNVHMGSGDLKHGLEMKVEDLLKAVGEYRVEKLV